MPYKEVYVAPELLVERNGIEIYRTYDEGDYNDPNTYHFAVGTDDEDDASSFDIREIAHLANHPLELHLSARRRNQVLRDLIDNGIITEDGPNIDEAVPWIAQRCLWRSQRPEVEAAIEITEDNEPSCCPSCGTQKRSYTQKIRFAYGDTILAVPIDDKSAWLHFQFGARVPEIKNGVERERIDIYQYRLVVPIADDGKLDLSSVRSILNKYFPKLVPIRSS